MKKVVSGQWFDLTGTEQNIKRQKQGDKCLNVE